MASVALFMAFEVDRAGDAAGRLDQVERHIAANVSPLADPSATALPAATKQVAERAVAEDAAEGLEDVVEVGEVRRSAARAIDARVAKAIVARPFVGVAEDFERLGRLFEALDGFSVALVFVRMVLDRQLAIGRGDFLVRRASARLPALRNNHAFWP